MRTIPRWNWYFSRWPRKTWDRVEVPEKLLSIFFSPHGLSIPEGRGRRGAGGRDDRPFPRLGIRIGIYINIDIGIDIECRAIILVPRTIEQYAMGADARMCHGYFERRRRPGRKCSSSPPREAFFLSLIRFFTNSN